MNISIDPSLTSTACCFTKNDEHEFFLIGTQKNQELPQSVDYTIRLVILRDEIEKIIDDHGHPMYAAVEGLSFGSIGRIAELGALSYFIREMLMKKNIPFIVIPPTVLKKYWTGKGNCSKIDMITEALRKDIKIPYLKKYKGIELPDDNCVDAVALSFFLKDYLNNTIEEFNNKIDCWNIK